MSSAFGILGFSDRDATVDQIGQQAVYEAVTGYMTRINAEINKAFNIFVQDETDLYKYVHYLPGTGTMQRTSRTSRPEATKTIGSYEVALPLYEWKEAVGWDDVTLAYMTMARFESHISGVQNKMINTRREEVLRALFNNTNETFLDERWGSLTIRRLANTDGTLYPPLMGADAEAERERFLVSGYTSANISDTNNPYRTGELALYKDFDKGHVVAFINSDEQAVTEKLSTFVPVTGFGTAAGANRDVVEGVTNTPEGRDSNAKPGTLIGYVNDVEVRKWERIPSGYILFIDEMQDKPIKRRVDTPTSIRGWQLLTAEDRSPLQGAIWRLREGYAVEGRLNGLIIQLKASGSYAIPAKYA